MSTMTNRLIAICWGGCEDVVLQDIFDNLAPLDPSITAEIFADSKHPPGDDSLTLGGRTIFKGDAGCGKILVETNLSPTQVKDRIRSVQYWLSFLGASTAIETATISGSSSNLEKKDSGSSSLQKIDQILRNAEWKRALNTWNEARIAIKRQSVNNDTNDDNNNKESNSLTEKVEEAGNQLRSFCGRCIRSGKHSFSSQDVSMQIGASVTTLFNWKVDLTRMDYEIVAIVLNETVVLGINITNSGQPFLKNKFPAEVRAPVVPSSDAAAQLVGPTLRPSTAAVLLRILQPQKYDIIVNPVCGTGVALIEGALCCEGKCISIGGDADQRLSPLIKANIDSLKNWNPSVSCSSSSTEASTETSSSIVAPTAAIVATATTAEEIAVANAERKTEETCKSNQFNSIPDAVLWGSAHMPLQDGVVDIAVLDIPFRKTAKCVPRRCQYKTPKIAEDVARILCPGAGRAAFLLQSHQQLVSCLDSVYFQDVEVRPVNVGGYACSLVTAYRSEEKFVRTKEQIQEQSIYNKTKKNTNEQKVELVSNELQAKGSWGTGGAAAAIAVAAGAVAEDASRDNDEEEDSHTAIHKKLRTT